MPVPRRYFLTGLARCGLCGTKLVAAPRTKTAQRTYTCRSSAPAHGCGGIRVNAEELEDLVRDSIVIAAGTEALAGMLQATRAQGDEAELLEQVRTDQAALEELAVIATFAARSPRPNTTPSAGNSTSGYASCGESSRR